MKLYEMEPAVLSKKVIKDTQSETPKRKKKQVESDAEDQENHVPKAPKKKRTKTSVDQENETAYKADETPVKHYKAAAKEILDSLDKNQGKKKAVPKKKEPETEVVVEPKTKTAKQLEAIEKRKQKVAEKKAQEEALKKEIAAKEKELAEKKEAQKEKRRLARQAKKSQESSPQVDSDDLHKEFKKHVSAVKKAEQFIAPPEHKAEVVKEVAKEAKTHWQDEGFRNQIKNEIIDHNQRMRQMIFPNRPLKL